MTAPKPENFDAMVKAAAAGDDAEFHRQCTIYAASLGNKYVDITQPRYSREDVRALSGD